jgi:hypothetical protein
MGNVKHCVATRVREVLLVAMSDQPPRQSEWEEVMRVSFPGTAPRAVIVSNDGANPSAFQRKQLRERLLARQSENHELPPMVLLTDSIATRITIVALRLFLKKAPVPFSPRQWAEAVSFAGLLPDESGPLWESIQDLRASIGLAPLLP